MPSGSTNSFTPFTFIWLDGGRRTLIARVTDFLIVVRQGGSGDQRSPQPRQVGATIHLIRVYSHGLAVEGGSTVGTASNSGGLVTLFRKGVSLSLPAGAPMLVSHDRGDLVVIANRLPVHRSAAGGGWETSPGGLVSALMPILREHNGVWIGWAGSSEANLGPFEHDGLFNVPVSLSAEEVRDYYEGFSNSTLWPLYHDACQTPQYNRSWWAPYVAVNHRFAEVAARETAPNGHVLVQDYHLQLVPGMLREMR
ncbi:hypothetical protein EBU58_14820, partial [bacterium]|nr:hypothetical protein [bacterium]